MDGEFWSWLWAWWDTYKASREHIVPFPTPLATFVTSLLTVVVGGAVAGAALWQARTARERHAAQTNADRERRITESFTKAAEQLGSDKLEVRLGGIYTLERISRESKLDYWPIMEMLTGFVRERARWKSENTALPQTIAEIYQNDARQPSVPEPPADIAAVLTVIRRRDVRNLKREKSEDWKLDFTSADMRLAMLHEAHLERADLRNVHLEGANLRGAHLEGAFLREAHLEGAWLEGADLSGTIGLTQEQLDKAFGNAETQLPEGLIHPAHWLSKQDSG